MNRLQLLKILAPGFLPLLVFIAADALWGTQVGLIVAVASGIAELAYSYARERTWDRFVLADTLLIIAMGGVSLLLENDVFFRLKPAVIELVFCLLLGVSVYSPLNIMQAMTRRYLKNISLDPEQERAMTRSMKVLLFLFLGHSLLIVYAAFALSAAAWGFISGGLFYILFATYFLAEWLRNRRRARRGAAAMAAQYADDEWFDLVDIEGKVIGRAPRRLCHLRKGLLHPVVHMHLLNSQDRLFLQKRSQTKEIQPGKWDTAVGGHVRSGETVEQALKREAAEELGLEEFKALPVARYVWESDVESELVHMFVARTNRCPRIDPAESTEGRFWKIAKVREAIGKGILTPNLEFEFPILMQLIFGEKPRQTNATNPQG
ncbi:MAG: NUDIX domain-containing protein [Candidatus Aminicenantes bacterium]|nr:NUDIX domain-containing protein [Candidatus Aminicenantes bacterium]